MDDNPVNKHNKLLASLSKNALKYKEKGNAWFSKGDYNNAYQSYTDAIQLNPNDAILYNNRAQTLIKLNKYIEAIEDCNKAINLINKSIGSGDSKQQEKLFNPDYKDYIHLNPSILKILSKSFFRRGLSRYELLKNKLQISDIDKNIQISQCIGDFKMILAFESSNAIAKQYLEILQKYQRSFEVANSGEPTLANVEMINNYHHSLLTTQNAPQNLYQFLKDMSFLSKLQIKNINDQNLLFKYISKINPTNYPVIFGKSLEYSHLEFIIKILKEYSQLSKNQNNQSTNNFPIDVLGHLEHLSNIKRFDTIVTLFLNASDKQNIKEILSNCESNISDKSYRDRIIKIYKLYSL
ncbi:unnamed protein product [Gordionus sp. m RMFG-2023]|uniref:sperm-associated antigen 1-like n=1 Tax=Gordionus sp. m RMFG-2023 TaxID=3053472 RepID=UPI0030DE583E